jgi:hypothetical protein
MKKWKIELLKELNIKALEEREIFLKETAASVGIKKIKRNDALEIACKFLAVNGDYRPIKMLDNKQDKRSLFQTLVFSELEYD